MLSRGHFNSCQNNHSNCFSPTLLSCEPIPVEIQHLIGNLGPNASSVDHGPRCCGDAWYNRKGLLAIFYKKCYISKK